MLSFVPTKVFFIVIPIVLFIHEMEEWNIAEFHKKNYKIHIDETNMSVRLWLFTLSLIGLFFAIVSLSIENQRIANSVFLILTTFLLINGLQHLVLSIVLKKYNPGLIFGGFLGTALSLFYAVKLVREDIIPLWIFLAITLLEFIPAVYDSIQSRRKDRLPKMIALVLRFGRFAERKLRE